MVARRALVLASALAGGAALRAGHVDDGGAAARVCSGVGARQADARHASFYWSGKNGGAGSSGSSEHVAPSNISRGPAWSWKDVTDDIVNTHPCIDGERNIYLASRDGVVRKFKPSGETVWQNFDAYGGQFAVVLVGSSALMDGAIHVGFADGGVASIDMDTGRTRWRVKVSPGGAGPEAWSLFAQGGVLVVAGRTSGWKRSEFDSGGNDQLVALDARDGRTLWTYRPPAPVYRFLGSFAEGPPSLLFADAFGTPHRLSLCDGRLLWRNAEGRNHATASAGGAILDASGTRVFVVGNDVVGQVSRAAMAAYDARTGAQLWRRTADLPAAASPAVGSLSGRGGNLSLVVPLGEKPGLPDQGAERSGRFADGRPVAFASRVYALDAATGEPTKWEFTPPVYRSPAASGDKLPVHLCLPEAWSGATIGGDGTVYLGHMSGRLYALKDVDGDGAISAQKGEVTEHVGDRCYQGSPGVAPGMLVATPCDGMHVFSA